jgi:hypothetical protein
MALRWVLEREDGVVTVGLASLKIRISGELL